jgi:Restriction alleviation protein Lar
MERVDHFGLSPCPFCGGKALFHGHKDDPECHGCHHIECTQCGVMVDLAITADPSNESVALTQLRRLIAPHWNRRAVSASDDLSK